MTLTRLMRAGVGVMLVASIVGVAVPVSAAPGDLLKGHGVFENPIVKKPGKTLKVGTTFDGWEVRNAPVTLSRAYIDVLQPPQGLQVLVLVDAYKNDAQVPGVVCRPAKTKAGHRYRISFWGGAVSGTANIVVKIGANAASVSAPRSTFPAVFKHFRVTVRAPIAGAAICFTASRVIPAVYPAIDVARAVDIGP
jgi:hypothetical protein